MKCNDKVLIVMPSMTSGGAEKSLINFLNELKNYYSDIELLLFNKNGIFITEIPKEVKVLETPKEIKVLYGPFKNIMIETEISLIKRLKILFIRVISKIVMKKIKNRSDMAKTQYIWKHYKNIITEIDKNYDIAIAYQQTHPINLVIEKIRAKKKFGIMHSSYKGNNFNYEIDRVFFKKLDCLFGVSHEIVSELEDIFDNMNIKCMPNIICEDYIRRLASCETNIKIREKKFNIVTIGRLVEVKGYKLMLEAIKKVKEKKEFEFVLYIIGEGELKDEMDKYIEENGLKEEVILLGTMKNPYKVIERCDLYIQTSSYEGYGMAMREASILKKPILATNFECARIHVKNNKNGLIVNHDSKEIRDGIIDIFKEYEFYSNNAKNIKLEEDEGIKVFLEEVR